MIFFHNPNEENGYLSNWYECNFTINNIKFTSSEQYMMYSKAKLFSDEQIANEILQTNNCKVIKDLGRQVSNFDENIWKLNREQIMYNGLIEKFKQNKQLAEKLIATGDDILAECAVKDTIWGIGLSMKDNKRFDTNRWRGQNLLGKVLMDVRYSLVTELY